MTDTIKQSDKEEFERIFESLSREQLYWLSDRAKLIAQEKDELYRIFSEENKE